MKRELREYLLGERNVVEDKFILSRETTGSAELVRLSHRELEEPIVKAWQPKQRRFKKAKKPKHTGGKKPYIMLMLQENDRIAEKLTPEGAFFLFRTFRNIDWGTGVLIDLRTKEPLKFVDLLNIVSLSKRKLLRAIRNLKELQVLENKTGEGYIISRCLVKRGARDEDKI